MKNYGKITCFFLIFISFCSIMPLERQQKITTIQTCLQYLEPKDPLVPRICTLFENIRTFIIHKKGLGVDLDFTRPPLFLSCNSIDKELFLSFPFINITIQIVNFLYPYTPLNIISNNVMAVSMDYFLFNCINEIIPDKEHDQSSAIYICKTICSLGLPLIAQYNSPDLFATYTHLSLHAMTYESSPQLFLLFYITNKFFSDCSPIKEINHIFYTKQTMFLIAVILACFNIKLKNNKLLTNPAYWLPVGIAHLLFSQYKLPFDNCCAFIELYVKTCSFFGAQPTSNKYDYKHNALKYMCYNFIPITAVLISAALPV
jgi:hypothetical protein